MSEVAPPVSPALSEIALSALAVASGAGTKTAPRPRVWPGVAIVALQWLVVIVTSWLAPATMIQFMAMFYAPMVGLAAVAVWWVFASRVPWSDRFLTLGVCLLAGVATYFLRSPDFPTM